MSNDNRTPIELLDDIARRIKPGNLRRSDVDKVKSQIPDDNTKQSIQETNELELERLRQKYNKS